MFLLLYLGSHLEIVNVICPSGGTGRRTGLKILRGNTRTGSIPVSGTFLKYYAQIAQLVEQRTENPRVLGSIPSLGILFSKLIFARMAQW